MDINNLFIIFFIFLFVFIISKKINLFNDDISYSNHKIIGSENRSPLVIGGVFFLIVFLYFNPYSSINFNITILLITILGLMSDKNINDKKEGTEWHVSIRPCHREEVPWCVCTSWIDWP